MNNEFIFVSLFFLGWFIFYCGMMYQKYAKPKKKIHIIKRVGNITLETIKYYDPLYVDYSDVLKD